MISPEERARDGARLGRIYRDWLQSVRRGVDHALARGDGVPVNAVRAAGYGGGLADRRDGDGGPGRDGREDRRGG